MEAVPMIVEGQMTGVHKHETKAYPPNLRFERRETLEGTRLILQEQWEVGETDYDNETSRSWKEWRDVPVVDEEVDSP